MSGSVWFSSCRSFYDHSLGYFLFVFSLHSNFSSLTPCRQPAFFVSFMVLFYLSSRNSSGPLASILHFPECLYLQLFTSVLTCAHVCPSVLTCAHVCPSVLTWAYIRTRTDFLIVLLIASLSEIVVDVRMNFSRTHFRSISQASEILRLNGK